jgi:predicted Fe-Mo cluster-binding NifX family protein
MKFAITSQNFRTVTGHAGKSRRFLVYSAEPSQEPLEIERLDLPRELAFHEFRGEGVHPVDGVDVIITGGAGAGFVHRLAARGIRVAVTGETDPLAAIRRFFDGTLPPPLPHDHHH